MACDTCTTSCATSCYGTCAQTCSQSCGAGCSGTCSNSCSGGCAGNCTGSSYAYCSSTTCSAACMYGCYSACYNACTGCTNTCNAGCTVSCGYSCSSGCNGCTATCSSSCSTSCTGYCGDGCTSTCGDGCTSACGGNCTGSCSGTCTSTCGGNCTGACLGTCTGTCAGSCTGSATIPTAFIRRNLRLQDTWKMPNTTWQLSYTLSHIYSSYYLTNYPYIYYSDATNSAISYAGYLNYGSAYIYSFSNINGTRNIVLQASGSYYIDFYNITDANNYLTIPYHLQNAVGYYYYSTDGVTFTGANVGSFVNYSYYYTYPSNIIYDGTNYRYLWNNVQKASSTITGTWGAQSTMSSPPAQTYKRVALNGITYAFTRTSPATLYYTSNYSSWNTLSISGGVPTNYFVYNNKLYVEIYNNTYTHTLYSTSTPTAYTSFTNWDSETITVNSSEYPLFSLGDYTLGKDCVSAIGCVVKNSMYYVYAFHYDLKTKKVTADKIRDWGSSNSGYAGGSCVWNPKTNAGLAVILNNSTYQYYYYQKK